VMVPFMSKETVLTGMGHPASPGDMVCM
jgi:hypothetical protein